MEHHFNVELAEEVGVNAAIIYNNIKFWCLKNKANNQNYHDGFYWTYNSVKAMQDLFPYMGHKQISNALKKLIDCRYIKTGNYNEKTYDRTLWYADLQLESTIFPFGEMENDETQNGICQNGKPIPDRKPDNKNTDKKTEQSACADRSPTDSSLYQQNANESEQEKSESKGISAKERKGKRTEPPSYDEVIGYFAYKGYLETDAESFYQRYTDEDWHRSAKTGSIMPWEHIADLYVEKWKEKKQ